MLRIIAGQLKSRLFAAVRSKHTHPMSDRGRMALFNMLGDLSEVESVLDAFGGSGALAFEALSRGAKSAVIIEMNGKVYQQLRKNIEVLGLQDRVDAYRANNVTCLNNLGRQFELVFLDPPFEAFKADQLLKLADYLVPGGHLILSHPPAHQSPFKKPLYECLSDKRYARLCLKIYLKR